MEEDEIDGFECMMQFKNLLHTLNPSQQSVTKVAQFAVKKPHWIFYDTLFGCIITKIDETPLINRLNLLYVLDSICQMSIKQKFYDYINLMKKEIVDIMEKIVPNDDPVNLNQAKKLIKNWKARHIFSNADLEKVEARICLLAGKEVVENPDKVYSKAEIMKRIEEDRDRHKKSREEGWYRPDNTTLKEFEEMYQKIPALSDMYEAQLKEDLLRYVVSRRDV